MYRYIGKRLCLLLIVILGVTVLTFTLMHAAPGDMAEMIAISRYGAENLTTAEVEAIRLSEGLDSPVMVQYFHWLTHMISGDFGNSLITGEPVLEEILIRLPATLKLSFAALLVSLVIAIPAGVIAASKQHSLMDYLTMSSALIGTSVPNFWLGLLLILLFSVTLGWFPVFGYGGLRYMVLPALTLGAGLAGITTRLTRSSMLEVLNQDYVTTARSKGLSERRIIFKHALKNAFIPIITVIGIQLGHLLGGTVIVESIFAWPGIGKLLVDSIYARDFATVQACALLFAIIFVLINLIVDVLYLFLNPKISYQKE
ncbi:nickel ABC transporter permease [Acetobacterium carbinolicum]|jgi:ABC-type dipeptide/oligopeptide/nickel transport systems, permease components|uniref:nickel ABC transporter permease n=1 Tax=Acetobacterium carbinolicum TaxID=52690 RepID=UPI0029E371E2|nr:peptide/nickel transport system permease protein [Eubacteriaceae bacterium]MDK2961086.1 peptide/nickel transport system permease protein [Eubacteriaceae bacterium]